MNNGDKLEQFEAFMKRARLGRETVRSYLGIARSYAVFCKGKGFASAPEAAAGFLSSFSERGMSVAYQHQALNALAGRNGLYAALGKSLGELPDWVKSRRPVTVPGWVTQSETESICCHLSESWELMVKLMFGAGLRVSEVTSLRWRDLDFERLTITVKRGKGQKDRVTFLPKALVDCLRLRSKWCRGIWEEDRSRKRAGVYVPKAVSNKSPGAGEQWGFFWVFPSSGESRCPDDEVMRRHHTHQKSFARPLRVAVSRAGIAKRVTAHAFRHGFATAYLLAGGNLRELMELMGHKSIETTEIYLHCLPSFTDRVGSPLDQKNLVPFVAPGIGVAGSEVSAFGG